MCGRRRRLNLCFAEMDLSCRFRWNSRSWRNRRLSQWEWKCFQYRLQAPVSRNGREECFETGAGVLRNEEKGVVANCTSVSGSEGENETDALSYGSEELAFLSSKK